jgi:hypothetical protein
MNSKRSSRKLAPAWMFYLFSSFFIILGIFLAIRYENGIKSLIGGLFIAFLGLPFLLEPLNRKNMLPKWIARWYDRVAAYFIRPNAISPKKTVLATLLFIAVMLILFIRRNGEFGNGWPAPRIYLVSILSFLGLILLYRFLYGIIHERQERSTGSGKPNIFEEQTFFWEYQIGSKGYDTWRASGNIIMTIIPVSVGFFVSLCIPEERILGVIPLVLMIMVSYGQSAIFIREMMSRVKIESELRTAHDMQMGLMPKEDPKIDGFDISGICLPANEVGGDFFDYVWLNDAKSLLGIAVADVSGKAMKAAITAVMTSGMVYREIGTNETPKSILKKINRPMYLKTDKNVFTALSFTIIDLTKKELTFSNAGQMAPILRRNDTLQSIKVDGPHFPLGVQEVVEYNETTLQLQNGDILILFTDGIIEAKNTNEELWGFEKMEEVVKNLSLTLTAKEMCKALIAEANSFAGTVKQYDDMTVVVVKVL